MLRSLVSNWRYLLFIPLLLSAYLTAFFNDNGLSLLTPEALLAYFTYIVIGLVFGCLLVLDNKALRVLIVTAAFAIFINLFSGDALQSTLYSHLSVTVHRRYLTLLFIVVLMPLVYLLYAKLDKFIAVITITFLLSLIFAPKAPFLSTQKYAPSTRTNTSLPPYIHIVLDEHIGFGAMTEEGVDYTFLNNLKKSYIGRGFRIYSKAYARDPMTIYSFAEFLNFKVIQNFNDYLSIDSNNNALKKNSLFERLSKKGYAINVLQSSYLDFCQGKSINFSKCITYKFIGIPPLNNASAIQKYLSILDISTPKLLTETFFWEKIFLMTGSRQSVLSPASASIRIFPEVTTMLKNSKPGNAYFIHLLMPHTPFVYDNKCNFIGQQEHIFKAYSEQVQCGQKIIGNLLNELSLIPAIENSTIVIQGDHGVRPLVFDEKYFLSSENIRNTFNAFFVVKAPFITAGYDQHELPLEYLTKSIINGHKPFLPYDLKNQYIFIRSLELDLGKHPMPSFKQ